MKVFSLMFHLHEATPARRSPASPRPSRARILGRIGPAP